MRKDIDRRKPRGGKPIRGSEDQNHQTEKEAETWPAELESRVEARRKLRNPLIFLPYSHMLASGIFWFFLEIPAFTHTHGVLRTHTDGQSDNEG